MKILKREYKLCLSCMEEHEVFLVEIEEENVFKGKHIQYNAIYNYCENSNEYFVSEEFLSKNDLAMKAAYRKHMKLLGVSDIINIREKYDISQMDLALVLGWGGKTITRYEGHHIQDVAHDTILRKIDEDPEWFLSLLEQEKSKFTIQVYDKYYKNALRVYEAYQDKYLRKSIEAQYAQFNGDEESCGNVELNLDKVVDVIRYLANSNNVTNLYKVKLMKLLWYIDALSFKKRGKSITGLAYKALPMGAVPVGHKTLIELKGIQYEEIDFGEGVGYHFMKSSEKQYDCLLQADIEIIEEVISILGRYTKEEIVCRMHSEKAYQESNPGGIIKYSYAKELSI